MNVRDALKMINIAAHSDTLSLDAQVLLAHILTKPRSWVLAHLDQELTLEQQDALHTSTSRFVNGEPLPYILGHWEFFGLDFAVSPDVLIPRPETELLVDKALAWLEHHPDSRSAIDVGTGSGCIAISLITRIQNLHMVATDISFQALAVAQRNAARFSVTDRIDFVCCDLLPSVDQSFELIVANLPYIPTYTMKTLPIHGREPDLALDGGRDGLDLMRRLITLAPKYISAGGMVLLEIESRQGMAALSLAYDTLSHASIHLHRDLSGRDRLLEIQTYSGTDRLS
jgi:release factor glutamine methyltransferase